MNKNDLLRAYFGKNEVIVEGGFCHPTKGHEVEIVGTETNIPRQSISVWELHYPSVEMVKSVFLACFNCTPEQARGIDYKKGVFKETPPSFAKKRKLALA